MATISPGIYEEISRALAETKRILDASKVPDADDDGVPYALVQRVNLLLQRLNGMGQELHLANRVLEKALQHKPLPKNADKEQLEKTLGDMLKAEYDLMQQEAQADQGIPPAPVE